MKGISKIVRGVLLKAVTDSKPGDALAIVDRYYPAVGAPFGLSMADGPPVVEMPGVSVTELLGAILEILPVLDAEQRKMFARLQTMNPDPLDDPNFSPDVEKSFIAAAAKFTAAAVSCNRLGREAFYREVGRAKAIVRTGSDVPYSNVVVIRGVGQAKQIPALVSGELMMAMDLLGHGQGLALLGDEEMPVVCCGGAKFRIEIGACKAGALLESVLSSFPVETALVREANGVGESTAAFVSEVRSALRRLAQRNLKEVGPDEFARAVKSCTALVLLKNARQPGVILRKGIG